MCLDFPLEFIMRWFILLLVYIVVFFLVSFMVLKIEGKKKMMYVTLLVATISKYQLVNH